MRPGQDLPGHTESFSQFDLAEATASDTATTTTVKTDPPAIEKQHMYNGVMVPKPGSPPFNLDQALSIELRSFQPQVLQVLQYQPIGPEAIAWSAFSSAVEAHMALVHLLIHYPGRATVIREGVLNITDVAWEAGWRPTAVAPADTIVPTDTSLIVLDARRSSHPAGFNAMSLRWLVDDTLDVQGGSLTAVTLPMGSHRLVLEVVDQYGLSAQDTMMVLVLGNTEGIKDTQGTLSVGGIEVPSPTRLNHPVPIRLRVLARLKIGIDVYDVRGRLIAAVFDGELQPGDVTILWDISKIPAGGISSGVYFVVVRSGIDRISRKILVVR